MGKNRIVSPEQIEEMKQMAIDGVQPQKMADHFGTAVSTIHGYKKIFKAQGAIIPSVRGRQPGSSTTSIVGNNDLQNRGIVSKSEVQKTSRNLVGLMNDTGSSTFIINGINVHIGSEAKSVNINKSPTGGLVVEITL